MWREVGVRLSTSGMVAAAEERAARESQTGAAGDARTRVAGPLASSDQ